MGGPDVDLRQPDRTRHRQKERKGALEMSGSYEGHGTKMRLRKDSEEEPGTNAEEPPNRGGHRSKRGYLSGHQTATQAHGDERHRPLSGQEWYAVCEY